MNRDLFFDIAINVIYLNMKITVDWFNSHFLNQENIQFIILLSINTYLVVII